METRKLIKISVVPYIYLDESLLSGTLENVSKNIISIKRLLAERITQVNKEGENIKGFIPLLPISKYKEIRIHPTNDEYNGFDMNIECFREQTDEEYKLEKIKYKERSDSAKKAAITKAEAKIKREKTLYENLKKKYEKTI